MSGLAPESVKDWDLTKQLIKYQILYMTSPSYRMAMIKGCSQKDPCCREWTRSLEWVDWPSVCCGDGSHPLASTPMKYRRLTRVWMIRDQQDRLRENITTPAI